MVVVFVQLIMFIVAGILGVIISEMIKANKD